MSKMMRQVILQLNDHADDSDVEVEVSPDLSLWATFGGIGHANIICDFNHRLKAWKLLQQNWLCLGPHAGCEQIALRVPWVQLCL